MPAWPRTHAAYDFAAAKVLAAEGEIVHAALRDGDAEGFIPKQNPKVVIIYRPNYTFY